jgi:Family of unknown function (DUF6533)
MEQNLPVAIDKIGKSRGNDGAGATRRPKKRSIVPCTVRSDSTAGCWKSNHGGDFVVMFCISVESHPECGHIAIALGVILSKFPSVYWYSKYNIVADKSRINHDFIKKTPGRIYSNFTKCPSLFSALIDLTSAKSWRAGLSPQTGMEAQVLDYYWPDAFQSDAIDVSCAQKSDDPSTDLDCFTPSIHSVSKVLSHVDRLMNLLSFKLLRQSFLFVFHICYLLCVLKRPQFYNYILTIHCEVSHVWFSRWSPTKVLFLLTRYLPVPAVLLVLNSQLLVDITWFSSLHIIKINWAVKNRRRFVPLGCVLLSVGRTIAMISL